MQFGQIVSVAFRIGIKTDLRSVGTNRTEHTVLFEKRTVPSPQKRGFHDQLLILGIISLGRNQKNETFFRNRAFHLDGCCPVSDMRRSIRAVKAPYIRAQLRVAVKKGHPQNIAT